METDTAISATEQLEQLRAELERRGWAPEMRGTKRMPYLNVTNPDELGLNGTVAARRDHYRWTWGPELGPLDDVPGAADAILTVLREVGP